MTFDETKHNRERDGKFASKPHAEAEGVTLSRVAYTPPLRYQRGDDGELGWEGDRFAATSHMPPGELVGLIQADIGEAQEMGWLPKTPTYRVSHSGVTNTVKITVTDLPGDREVYDYAVDIEDGHAHLRRTLKPEYAQMLTRLEELRDAYNEQTLRPGAKSGKLDILPTPKGGGFLLRVGGGLLGRCPWFAWVGSCFTAVCNP